MNNNLLTQRQIQLLRLLKQLQISKGRNPTLQELKDAFGVKTISGVQKHLTALIRKGYVTSDTGGITNLKIRNDPFQQVKIPLIGHVACGAPIFADENILAYIPYANKNLNSNPESYFFLEAVGDSMNKAGIENGDYILVKGQNDARENEIVLALLDDEVTVKKYKKGNGFYILEPESTNAAHKPMYIFEDFSIQGVVVDVLKKEK